MNKKIMAPIVLFVICAVVGIGMALVNSLTAPIIEENTRNEQKKIFEEFYSDMTDYKESTEGLVDKIEAKYEILKDSTTLGYVYKASGSNSYGNITMLVAVSDGMIVGVDYLNNEQTKNPGDIESVGKRYENGSIDSTFTETQAGVTVGSKLINELMDAVKKQALSEGGSN